MNLAKKSILVLGGSRSGKSIFAENLVESIIKSNRDYSKIYIATAQAFDEEMQKRIKKHRERRSENWITLNVPLALSSAITSQCVHNSVVLVDCLTLWINNLMFVNSGIDLAFKKIYMAVQSIEGTLIMVSNEVGQGVIPENKIARQFKDYSGLLNQKIAELVDEVYLITAGLPQKLK